MTWFSLPETQAENRGAFSDSVSAARWLAEQPQANAPAMLNALATQIHALDTLSMPPRERYKTLEVLRKSAFAVSRECQRRYEGKPLPLLSQEKLVFEAARRLWRAYAVAYLHCLRACLDRDPAVVRYSARMAHRVLSCLRMEQLACYAASNELAPGFWGTLHAVLASAEKLGVVREPVEDSLLGETRESTVSGQYAMALLLHLARPFALSHGQFAATAQWFSRWREQADVLDLPDDNPRACCLAIDLAQDQPIHGNAQPADVARWLSLTNIMRKMRKRAGMLAEGESPESLKLGNTLSGPACVALLNLLSDHLRFPVLSVPEPGATDGSVTVLPGMENIYRALGGRGLKESETPAAAYGDRLSHEQLAVFDHVVVHAESDAEKAAESWDILKRQSEEIQLFRRPSSGDARLTFGAVLGLRRADAASYDLASITGLYARNEGLVVTVVLLPGRPAPLLVEIRERPTGKAGFYPALVLPGETGDEARVAILPAGLPARALSMRLSDGREQTRLAWRLDRLVDRGGDNERWAMVSEA
ncbi:hypothetical protein [Propionivibrio soli]|uniref:hypothetical protein n=1 Tax=Propionivibrio soli TaxID=2976531 RepID=UPI0021E8F58A|nr:hypothetical protein [Propionivibrio soli]